jgi:F0F1-type ATP synthase assembly protein I
MTGSVLGLGYIGYFIDTHYNTNPYGVLIGLLLGVTVGMYELLKIYISKK